MKLLTLPATAALLLALQPTTGEDTAAQFDVVRKSAVPVKRFAPTYPNIELRRGRQGWVDVSYVVTTEGEVIDAIVVDSSGSRAFERAAIQSVSRFHYEPATVNGQPVQQCETKSRISFAIDKGPGGVSRRFLSNYRRIAETIDAGDLSTASKKIDDSFETYATTLTEISWLWTLRARIAGLEGRRTDQLHAVRKATSSSTWVDPKLLPNLLAVRASLEIEHRLYADAIKTYERLLETGANDVNTEQLGKAIDTIRQVAESDQILSVPAVINNIDDCDDCRTNWQYDPLRNRFRIASPSGNLGNIEIRCQWQRFIDKADSDQVWEIDPDWGECSIVVFGEPGTSFELHELPQA